MIFKWKQVKRSPRKKVWEAYYRAIRITATKTKSGWSGRVERSTGWDTQTKFVGHYPNSRDTRVALETYVLLTT